MSENTLNAIRLLGSLTRNRFDVWMLAGNHNARLRQDVMTLLTGATKRVPQAKSGVNAIIAEFYRQLGGVEGDCIAVRERNFWDICRKAVYP